MPTDRISLDGLSYDSGKAIVQFKVKGYRHGKPFLILGNLPAPLPAERSALGESEASKAALKHLLRDVADKI